VRPRRVEVVHRHAAVGRLGEAVHAIPSSGEAASKAVGDPQNWTLEGLTAAVGAPYPFRTWPTSEPTETSGDRASEKGAIATAAFESAGADTDA
jgi:hypothetical protein